MKKQHILVVSQYFYPEDFRVNDLCEAWINKGYQVTVLTGIPNYPKGKYYKEYGLFKKRKELYKGISIIRIPLVPRGRNSIMLALNYLSFIFFGFFWSFFTRLEVDRVFIYEVSPMTQALPGVWYANRREIPCDIYVLDLWPENFEIITGIKNKYIVGSLTRMVTYIYQNSDKIFVSSKRFSNSISDKGNFSHKIKYWPQYAEDFYMKNDILNENPLKNNNELIITFAGNVGYAQGLNILPKAAEVLKREQVAVKFVIIGDGRYKKEFENEVTTKSVQSYFKFVDKKPASSIPEYFSYSDVSLITLSDSEIFSMTIPAKLQSSMACGIPILVAANGEVNQIVKDAKCGFSGEAENIAQLVNNIIKISKMSKLEMKKMGDNSLRYYQENFDKEALLAQMDKYLEE